MRSLLPFRFGLSKTLLFIAGISSTISAHAREGMWLPPNIREREADMKAMGLRIATSQLYNDQGTGLNNAVVLFGGGCTGELISSKGLVLTNHHCGYGPVQRLSSRDADYFANGFWAMNNTQEIPCPSLTVTFIRKMDNVTDKILYNLPDTMSENARDTMIARRVRALEKGYRQSTGMDVTIQPYFRGNQYWASISETYRDVRLVGFPPNGIGAFGGDTDNWMWPRHTGDFSLFRIYADAKGRPVAYNKTNKPYTPKRFFNINISGYQEGDFTMVYGFPGTTQEYIASPQLSQVYRISDPIRIDARTRKLEVWNNAMAADRDVFLKYTSKRAGLANGWKKWQGEVRGLNLNNVTTKKMGYENSFQSWVRRDTTLPYADNLLSEIQAATAAADSALKAEEYIREAVLGVELIQQGAELDKLLQVLRKKKGDESAAPLAEYAGSWDGFYKNYDAATDQKVFEALMPLYMEHNPGYIPSYYNTMLETSKGDYDRWARSVYRTSIVADPDKLNRLFAGSVHDDTMMIRSDPSWQLYDAIARMRARKVTPVLSQYSRRMTRLNRLYMAAQMAYPGQPKALYPDANLTLRLTYGKINGIDPEGPAGYSWQTNLDEAIGKDQPDVEEFRVPQRLKDLQAAHDYGRWGVNGTVPVAFIADNHTSGGNSGSPVLNARGELIGTNFDRIWEGTMSDLYFDPKLCRNISLDVRYTLFIIEKFGKAGWLLKEMKLVKG